MPRFAMNLLLLVGLIAGPPTAIAQNTSDADRAGWLLGQCESPEGSHLKTTCIMYFTGYMHGVAVAENYSGKKMHFGPFCPGSLLSPSMMIQQFVDYGLNIRSGWGRTSPVPSPSPCT
jgi:hypothetical protein